MTGMPETLFAVAVLTVAVSISLLTLAVMIPPLYREARRWFEETPRERLRRLTREETRRRDAPGGNP